MPSFFNFFDKKQCFLALLFSFFTATVFADNGLSKSLFPSRTAYVGINIGGGSTEWEYLVDTTDVGGPSSTGGSTPSTVTEGGPSWGVVFGYFVGKNFSIELQYEDFANSTLGFVNTGVYQQLASCPLSTDFKTPNCTIVSKTQAYSLSGKLFVQVGETHVRAFGAVGAGLVERSDVIATTSGIAPYMSAGLDYNFTRHWVLESGFQYYTGFGASEVNPANNFVPFAWDAYGRLAYQF